jgi:hypothetical protein
MLTIKSSMTDTKDLLSKICEQISGEMDEVVDLKEDDHQKINFIPSKQFATKKEFELWLNYSLPDKIMMDELKSVFPEWIPIRKFVAAKETEKLIKEEITVDSVNNDDFLSPAESSVNFNSRVDEDKYKALYFAIISGSSTLRKNRNSKMVESSDGEDNQNKMMAANKDSDNKKVAAEDSAPSKDNPYRLKMLSFIGKIWAKLNFDHEYDSVAGMTFTEVQDLVAYHVHSFMTVNTTSIELEIPIQEIRGDKTFEVKEIRFPSPVGI